MGNSTTAWVELWFFFKATRAGDGQQKITAAKQSKNKTLAKLILTIRMRIIRVYFSSYDLCLLYIFSLCCYLHRYCSCYKPLPVMALYALQAQTLKKRVCACAHSLVIASAALPSHWFSKVYNQSPSHRLWKSKKQCSARSLTIPIWNILRLCLWLLRLTVKSAGRKQNQIKNTR